MLRDSDCGRQPVGARSHNDGIIFIPLLHVWSFSLKCPPRAEITQNFPILVGSSLRLLLFPVDRKDQKCTYARSIRQQSWSVALQWRSTEQALCILFRRRRSAAHSASAQRDREFWSDQAHASHVNCARHHHAWMRSLDSLEFHEQRSIAAGTPRGLGCRLQLNGDRQKPGGQAISARAE